MLRTKVKASAVTHLTDARYFAAWEATWLGFQLSPGAADSVDARLVSTLREWVDGVKICAEYSLAEADEVLAAHELLKLDAVQLGMLTPLETLTQLHGKLELIQELVVEAYADMDELEALLEERKPYASYFILNFTKGGLTYEDIEEGTPLTTERLANWAKAYPILIDITLANTTPSELLERMPLQGFAIQGGAEEKVGYKSFDELDEFFEDLEELV